MDWSLFWPWPYRLALEDLNVLLQHTLLPPERLHGLRAWPRACVRQRPCYAGLSVKVTRTGAAAHAASAASMSWSRLAGVSVGA